MESPIDVGATGAVGTTGRTGDISAIAARRVGTALAETDATLIARVRDGDMDAYGELYERHVDNARRLARRLCRDPHEVDDVVSEVFANTLRALRRGSGPSDDLKPYLLRSLRHTVVNLRTRKDTGRATPTPGDELDLPSVEEPVRFADAVSHAFVELPPRFQDVLWMTCIEGRTPVEVGSRSDLEPGAVASLAHRARRALGRSYLTVATRQPHVPAGCAPIRDLLPSYVQGNAAAATARRVHRHLEGCAGCNSVSVEMSHLNKSLASISTIALVKALIHRWRGATAGTAGAIGAGTVAPLVMIAIVSGTLLSAGSSLADEGRSTETGDRPTSTVLAPAANPDSVTEIPDRTLDRAEAAGAGDGAGIPLDRADQAGTTAGPSTVDASVDALDSARRAAVLSGADPAVRDLAGLDLAGLDLAGLDLAGLDLARLDLAGLDLAGLDLSAIDPAVLDAILASLGLEGLDLSAIDLSAIDLSAIDLSAIDLSAIDLSAIDPELIDAAVAGLGVEAGVVEPTPSSSTPTGEPADLATTVPTTLSTTVPTTPSTSGATSGPTTVPSGGVSPPTLPAAPTTVPTVSTTVPAVSTTVPTVSTTLPTVPTTVPSGPLDGLDTGS